MDLGLAVAWQDHAGHLVTRWERMIEQGVVAAAGPPPGAATGGGTSWPCLIECMPGSDDANGTPGRPAHGRVTVLAARPSPAPAAPILAPILVAGSVRAAGDQRRLAVADAGQGAPSQDPPACPAPPVPSTSGPRFHVAPDGDDGGDGQPDRPWRTLGHGVAQLRPGDTLLVHGGTYHEPGIKIRAQGRADAPITIAAALGERVVVDGSLAEFRTAGNDQWVPVDDDLGLYRSRATYEADSLHGKLWASGRYYALNVYPSRAALAGGFEYDEGGEYYVGPGLHWDPADQHIYIRLQPPDPRSVHGWVFAVPSDPDPRNSALFIGINRAGLLLDDARQLVVRGLELIHFYRGVEVLSGSDIALLDTRVVPGRTGVLFRGVVRNAVLRGVTVEAGFPAWISWRDVKSDARVAQALKLSGLIAGDAVCLTVANSRFADVFDGIMSAGRPERLRIIGNEFDGVIDDSLQLGTAAAHVEFAYNLILGAGPSHHGSGPSPAPGTKYFHHNVLEVRTPELYARPGQGEPGWRFHIPIPAHGRPSAGPDPWKIYNNTFLFQWNSNGVGAGQKRWGPRTGPPHEVYNNIFVQYSDHELAAGEQLDDGAEIYDGNLYHRPVEGASRPFFGDWRVAGQARDFASLAAFRRSDHARATAAYYPPGWERHGVEADPELPGRGWRDYRPAADGPAATGALDLSATGWPGTQGGGYRGAVDPKAPTGLGAVGRATAGPSG